MLRPVAGADYCYRIGLGTRWPRMARYGKAEKVLYSLTAVGGLLVVVALALPALAGSGFGSDLLRGAAGGVFGMLTVWLLTRSPQRGRRIAAFLLLASVVGILAFVLTEVASPPPAIEEGRNGTGFFTNFFGWTVGASLTRLVGLNPMGPRGDQASRRRV